ncbi:MAG: SDR family oxidoreductase [Candidatus Aminicenantes bacterium]|nr:SDR family oxidoreductase [Candidatus Aminicenantes bacterium]
MKIDLTGMNILITGASRGIGQAIARLLGRAGAILAIHYHQNQESAQKLQKEIGSPSEIFQADLADSKKCIRLFEQVEEKFGHIDVLINNAGIAIQSPVELEPETWIRDWESTLKVNLSATALLCKLAIRHFLNHKGGRIINIASRAAFRGDTIDYLAYAASKGGMVSLTRSIARGFGKQNIKAFLIAPGFVRTDMAQRFIDFYGEEKTISDLALNRLTEPEDVAPMVVFLASGLADHATGGTFDINAGSYVH